ncbi:MAG: ATP:cob(I)alamin adenosyltransferase, partial [Anaerolineae bacterium]|nr:ATP:cob(I)alamin adenosyltransferase [Anaerolineae bacterium]
MKYYTRKGDEGYTSLLGNERVPKYAPRPEAYGTLDELSSALGLARATVHDERSREIILAIQRQLCQVMTELAATPTVATRVKKTTADDVTALERFTDALGAEVELPQEFIIPGDTLADA